MIEIPGGVCWSGTGSAEFTDTQRLDWMIKTRARVVEPSIGHWELYLPSRGLPSVTAQCPRDAIDAAMRLLRRMVSRRRKLPLSLFDSHAVWLEVHKHAPLSSKITPTQVADVLDAVVAIERKAAKHDSTTANSLSGLNEPAAH
jgi:hypothetical protein